MPNPILIAPSLLAADFSRLGEEVRAVEAAGADWIHLDVMDGHFVPNITFGPALIRSIKPCTTLPLDVHLMISPVDPFIPGFAEAGGDLLTVHLEASPHIHRSLQLVRSTGKKIGVTLNPGTAVQMLQPVIGGVDLVLVMSVNPGFGGQAFITDAVQRVQAIRQMCGDREVRIQVDGGVDPDNARSLVDAGADTLVAGSSVFKGGADRYAANIAALRQAATSAQA